jgi:pyridoxine 5-phosphate synthase
MTKLSVNINKIAVLRNSRGGNLPDLYQVAIDCEAFGAQGITVHPRPDERHIRYSDLDPLKALVTTEFNIEGYPDDRFMDKVLSVKPHQCTLVPDPPGVLTSSCGWDTIEQRGFLQDIVGKLKETGIRVSLFVDPIAEMIEGAALCGTDRVELYTGDYAQGYKQDRELALAPHIAAAQVAASFGLGLNAGHDLNLDNLADFQKNVPGLLEVSIGHALINDALYYGLHNTIQMYLQRL